MSKSDPSALSSPVTDGDDDDLTVLDSYSLSERSFLARQLEQLSVLSAAHYSASRKYYIIHLTLSMLLIVLPLVTIAAKIFPVASTSAIETIINSVASCIASIALIINASKRSSEHHAGAGAYRALTLEIDTACSGHSPTVRPQFSVLSRHISDSSKQFEDTYPPLDSDILLPFAKLQSNISLPLELGVTSIRDSGYD